MPNLFPVYNPHVVASRNDFNDEYSVELGDEFGRPEVPEETEDDDDEVTTFK